MFAKSPAVWGIAAVLAVASFPAWGDGSGSGGGSWIGYVFGGNQAAGLNSAVVAGAANFAGAQGAFVGAGTANQATGLSAMVLGGFDNRATFTDALVGAGAGNRATGARSVIVGGGYNLASGHFSFIGGGGRDGVATTAAGTDVKDNVASRKWTVVVGGVANEASADGAAVVGGGYNIASGVGSFVGGGGVCCANDALSGYPNVATGVGSVISGGYSNEASGQSSTIGGGSQNAAQDIFSTVAGGQTNIASGQWATVAGGINNNASGDGSVVAGGSANTASGLVSFAAGYRAVAAGAGSFAIADSSSVLAFPVYADNGFAARYTGGFTFASSVNPTTGLYATGCQLFAGGGSWSCTSDRATKTDLTPIDPQSILHGVTSLPITQWRFTGEPVAVRHVGPMAQDFREAFGLGHDDKSISMLDAQGVALAAIQGLNAKVEQRLAAKDAEIARLRDELAELRKAVVVLTARASIEGRVAQAR